MPLKAVSISKRSGTKWALKDVTFDVQNGQVSGIFGPAGAGKTALLRIIAGLEKPDGGSFHTDEGSTAASKPFYIGRASDGGIVGRLKAVISGASSVELISAGSLMGRVRSSQSDLLIIDTEFSVLGDNEKADIFDELRGIARSTGACILLASRNFQDVLAACDSVLVLNNGEVLQAGTPQEVYLEPVSATAAQLTGRHNIFEARRLSSSKAENPEFQTIDGSHRLTARRTAKARLGPLNQNVRLAIRPEHLSISFGASFPEDNLLRAVVENVRFLGPNTLVVLDSNGLKLKVLVARLVGLTPGEECMISMPPDRVHVFTN